MNVQFDILNAGTTNQTPTTLNDYAHYIDICGYVEYGTIFSNTTGYSKLHTQLSIAYDQAIFNLNNQGISFEELYGDNLGVIFIHAGIGAENGDLSYIWSHKSEFYSSKLSKWINYNINPFQTPGSPNNTIISIGVICHESLHSFGLPDLYDTDYSSKGAGRSSIMASGSWGYRTPNYSSPWLPSYANTWTRNKLNSYFTTNIITISGNPKDICANIIIPPIGKINKSYRIDHPTRQDYWLIEYRTKYGFDRNIPNEGLAIWHISPDPNGDSNNSEVPPNNRGESGYKVALEQADGLFNLERKGDGQGGDIWTPNSGKEFSPFSCPSTVSNTGIPSGIRIYDMIQDGENMKFSVKFLDTSNLSVKINSVNLTNNNNSNLNVKTTGLNGRNLIFKVNNNNPTMIEVSNDKANYDLAQYSNFFSNGFNIVNINTDENDGLDQAFGWNYYIDSNNILNNSYADLTVLDLTLSGNSLNVTIKNIGTITTTGWDGADYNCIFNISETEINVHWITSNSSYQDPTYTDTGYKISFSDNGIDYWLYQVQFVINSNNNPNPSIWITNNLLAPDESYLNTISLNPDMSSTSNKFVFIADSPWYTGNSFYYQGDTNESNDTSNITLGNNYKIFEFTSN
jgi:M6 family metalloprotease-like protein